MGLPGFSAETSLYRSSNRYMGTAETMGGAGEAGAVTPAGITLREYFQYSLDYADQVYRPLASSIFQDHPPYFARACGAVGESCCRAPAASQNIPAFGPLVGCQKGLGCDITTGKCVSNCGKPGQPCCDGPETRAPKWTWDGKVYSPNSAFMVEMCESGACDRQSHRCFVCGMTDGAPCCPPDAAQATARCVGKDLECIFDPWGFATSGTCRACGIQGREPCDWGCAPGLGVRKGLCDVCGGDFQPPCDKGCNSGLSVAKGLCRQCGGSGQIPCDFGCGWGLKLKGGLCAVCGAAGQAPCDAGCDFGTVLRNGICTACGGDGKIPCAKGCNYPLKVAAGLCRYCGGNGQIPCDTGCNTGYVLSGGKCAPPTQPEDTCAKEGETCVADFVNGMHCCKSGNPLLCVQAKCRRCVPHGEECVGANRICCSAPFGDDCVLDISTGNAVCDIPDGPDN